LAAGVDDAQNFNDINDAMESIEFEKSEQDKIWMLLKAILEMGNI
jgi:myosin heavy subunit